MARLGAVGRWLVAGVAVAALFLAARVEPAAAQPLTRAVIWYLSSGQTQTFAFTGTLTGNTFTGTLDDGENPQTASGAVANDGSVSGAVRGAGGVLLGTFSGAGTTAGSFTLASGQAGGTWVAQ